jgi:hypothetical protein
MKNGMSGDGEKISFSKGGGGDKNRFQTKI